MSDLYRWPQTERQNHRVGQLMTIRRPETHQLSSLWYSSLAYLSSATSAGMALASCKPQILLTNLSTNCWLAFRALTLLVGRQKEHPTWKLKLIDRLRATRWTPPDYWQTDNSNGLIMVIRNYHWLNSASRVLISTCSAPLGTAYTIFTVWSWPLTYDLDLYSPRLAKVKVDPHAKNHIKGQTVQTGERPQTNRRTHGRYQTYYRPCYTPRPYAVDKTEC